MSLHQDLAQRCPLTKRELTAMRRYAVLLTRFQQFSRKHSLTDLAHHVVASLSMGEHVKKISKDAEEERDRWENLQELLKGTVKYSTHNHSFSSEGAAAIRQKSLVQFMQHVSLFTSDDGSGCSLVHDHEEDEGGQGQEGAQEQLESPVQLMTIHSSKGLEFDVVVLSGAEEGCLPLVRRAGSGLLDLGGGGGGEGGADMDSSDAHTHTDQEEERRLAYVAMTRAKTALVITHRRRTLLLTRRRGSRGRPDTGTNCSSHKLSSRKAKRSRFLTPLSKMKREDCIFVDRSGDSGEEEGEEEAS